MEREQEKVLYIGAMLIIGNLIMLDLIMSVHAESVHTLGLWQLLLQPFGVAVPHNVAGIIPVLEIGSMLVISLAYLARTTFRLKETKGS